MSSMKSAAIISAKRRWRPVVCLCLSYVLLGIMASCQSNITDRARESASNITANISNLPSVVLPSVFPSTARIDSDFSIPDATIVPNGEHAVITTYYSTNRTLSSSKEPNGMFGQRRANTATFGKSYSVLQRSGANFEIESETLLKVQINEPTENTRALKHVIIQDRAEFSSEITTRMRLTEGKRAMLYVHDFNVSFEKAANNAAKLAYDLGFSGTTFFFSWPARGDAPAYVADLEDAMRSTESLRSMIRDIILLTPTEQLLIVGEGMGALIASNALQSTITLNPEYQSFLKEIIFIAPDIENSSFTNVLAKLVSSANIYITLYASENYSNVESNEFFGEIQTPSTRNNQANKENVGEALLHKLTGATENGVSEDFKIEIIDMNRSNTRLAEAEGFADSSAILRDLWNLVHYGNRANFRNTLTPCLSAGGTFWTINPEDLRSISQGCRR